MSLNIKNPQTHALARDLARLTGETITAAITTAVRERLERLHGSEVSTRRAKAERLRALAEDAALRWGTEMRTGDPTTALYDDAGLPR